MEINFATSNPHKVSEAQDIATTFDLQLKQITALYPEVRAEYCADVAKAGARYVFEKLRKPVIVEDAGLFIKELQGFPGVYSKYVYYTIGLEGILKLLEKKPNRQASFISAVGYFDGETTKVFVGEVEGEIVKKALGSKGFGYDPIFTPKGQEKTFAQDPVMKLERSHRRQATEKFCQWFSMQKQ